MKKRISIAAGLIAALAFFYFAIDVVNRPLSLTSTFNRIYADGAWGKDITGKGTSGSASTLEITREYRAYIEEFIKKRGVMSVVDAGSGDCKPHTPRVLGAAFETRSRIWRNPPASGIWRGQQRD